jgi:hypothetical protein
MVSARNPDDRVPGGKCGSDLELVSPALDNPIFHPPRYFFTLPVTSRSTHDLAHDNPNNHLQISRFVYNDSAMSDQQDEIRKYDPVISARVPVAMHEVLVRQAAQGNQSVGSRIRYLLACALEQQAQPRFTHNQGATNG